MASDDAVAPGVDPLDGVAGGFVPPLEEQPSAISAATASASPADGIRAGSGMTSLALRRQVELSSMFALPAQEIGVGALRSGEDGPAPDIDRVP